MRNKRAVEMPDGGHRGKPTPGFPPCPPPLEIATRFPHSHSLGDDRRWKSGNPKAGFPLSHCGFGHQSQTQKGGLPAGRSAPAFRLIVQ
jgi:hypothetical protein